MANLRAEWGRRGFLTVGALGGLGLSLGDYFRLKQAAGRRRGRERRSGEVGDLHLPARRHGPPGDVRPQAVCPDRVSRSVWQHRDQRAWRVVCGQNLPKTAQIADKITIVPLDDPRRGGPRAGHPQHVHRLPAQPGPRTIRASASVVTHEFGPRDKPAALRLHSEPAQRVRRLRLPRPRPTARSASGRSGQRRFQGPRPQPARRRRRRALRPAAGHARRGQRPLPQHRESPTRSTPWTRSTSGPTA